MIAGDPEIAHETTDLLRFGRGGSRCTRTVFWAGHRRIDPNTSEYTGAFDDEFFATDVRTTLVEGKAHPNRSERSNYYDSPKTVSASCEERECGVSRANCCLWGR